MTTRIAMALLLGALTLAPGLATAEDTHSLEQLVVEMANTPAEHAALANHYRAKAEDARAEMRSHESMGRSYAAGKLADRIQMQGHCKKLSEQYGALASEYDALAKSHDAQAK